jgi:hypothetical protein
VHIDVKEEKEEAELPTPANHVTAIVNRTFHRAQPPKVRFHHNNDTSSIKESPILD